MGSYLDNVDTMQGDSSSPYPESAMSGVSLSASSAPPLMYAQAQPTQAVNSQVVGDPYFGFNRSSGGESKPIKRRMEDFLASKGQTAIGYSSEKEMLADFYKHARAQHVEEGQDPNSPEAIKEIEDFRQQFMTKENLAQFVANKDDLMAQDAIKSKLEDKQSNDAFKAWNAAESARRKLEGKPPLTGDEAMAKKLEIKEQLGPAYGTLQKQQLAQNLYGLKDRDTTVKEVNAKTKAEADALKNAPPTQEAVAGALAIYDAGGGLPIRNPNLQTSIYNELGKREKNGDSAAAGITEKNVRAGMTKAYATQQNMFSADTVSIDTLHKQFDRAKALLAQSGDPTGIPLANRPALWVKKNIFGEPGTSAYENMTTTMAYEFAKLMSGSSASIAGVTVSSSEDVKKIIDSAQTKEQFDMIIETMDFEAKTRIDARRKQMEDLRENMMSLGRKPSTPSTDPGATSQPSPASGAAQVTGGGQMVPMIAPDGKTRMVPQNQVDAALKAGGRRAP